MSHKAAKQKRTQERETVKIGPQPGPQEEFLGTAADIAIYGGAAGGGKSFGLLLEPLRHLEVKNFGAVIFRRNATQVTIEGGLWDESEKLYLPLGSRPAKHRMSHKFPMNVRVRFAHLEHDKTVHDWQGSQIAYIGFDELTHFTARQFFYMMSRNRSTCGVRPYIRATTNPDPDSWVAQFIAWWIDQNEGTPNYGQPIAERAGRLRWFIRVHNELIWADSKEELVKTYPRSRPKSVTFIPAKVTDNKILLDKDPDYLANLEALPYVDRMRLLGGNWKVRAVAGNFFRRSWFKVVEAAPKHATTSIRYWDRAATEPSLESPTPDWTVGLKLTRDHKGVFYVEHVERFQATSGKVQERIKSIGSQDGYECQIGLEQDPGSAGKSEANYLTVQLAGYDVRLYPATKAKEVRAKPASAQAEAGNICLVRGSWNETFLAELEAFPPEKGAGNDDQVDGLSGAVNAMCGIRPSAVKVVKDKDERRVPQNFKNRRGKALV